jgi:hypothetical protein
MARKKPYTEKGLSKLKCAHCGKPASEQWNVNPCQLEKSKRGYKPLCEKCDDRLNKYVIRFFYD